MRWAFIPKRFLANPIADSPTVFTSMFMHSGWAHLIGNMLYLWIFGDNVEDRLGRIKFLIFYFVAGIAATFAQLFFSPGSNLPHVGASGAIAGVLGAYILFFPHGKIQVLFGQAIIQMPALIVIGFWFVLQFISGFSSPTTSADTGGVAYMAHIGVFVAGLLIALVFKALDRKPL
jgi:membrane associated rhomboid family serine protease